MLDKSLYGLRQAPRAWFTCFAEFVIKLGFWATRSDSLLRLVGDSLFVLHCGNNIVYLLLYVDDIVMTGSSSNLLQHAIDRLHVEFAVKDMGALQFFLGINVQRMKDGFYLSQEWYANDILEHARMSNCKSATTLINANGKLSSDGPAAEDAKSYCNLAGALQYLTMTRPTSPSPCSKLAFICKTREHHT